MVLRYKLLCGSSVAVLMVLSSGVMAADIGAPGVYVGAEAGASFSQSAKWKDTASDGSDTFGIGKNVNADAGTGAVMGLIVGYRFNDMFRADLGIDYRTSYSISTSEARQLSRYKADIEAWTFMANGYFEPVRWGAFKPYFGAGIGTAVVSSTNASAFFVGDSTADPLGGQTRTNFAWQTSVGISYDVTDTIALDLGYRHLDAGEIHVGGNAAQNDSPSRGFLVTNEVLLGTRYSF